MGELFEWDEAKRQVNITKHDVDFSAMVAFDWETALVNEDAGRDEPRWVAIGYIGSRLHVVVYAKRGLRRRVISLRKANSREVRRYAETQI